MAKAGYEIVGRQVTVATAAGKRVVDFLVKDKFGKLFTVEVKTGAAKVTKAQVTKDGVIATTGGKIVGKNADGLAGQTKVMDALDVRVDVGAGCVTSCSMRGGGAIPQGKSFWDRLKSFLGV